MEEKELSKEEGLLLIQRMIEAAKQEQKDDGKGWIIWGWLLFFASLFTFLNLQFRWTSVFFFWNTFAAISIALLLFQAIRNVLVKRKKNVRTYTQDLYEKLNSGFFISLTLIIFSMNLGVPPLQGFALLLGLYGFWILIYGAVLNFQPSIVGAYITWAFAFASLFVKAFEWTMILHAIAVLCGYIVPGHLAYKEFNRLNRYKQERV